MLGDAEQRPVMSNDVGWSDRVAVLAVLYNAFTRLVCLVVLSTWLFGFINTDQRMYVCRRVSVCRFENIMYIFGFNFRHDYSSLCALCALSSAGLAGLASWAANSKLALVKQSSRSLCCTAWCARLATVMCTLTSS